MAAVAVVVFLMPATAPAAPILESVTAAGPAVSGTLQGASDWSPAVQNCGLEPASSFAVEGTFDASFIGRGTYSGQILRTSSGACPSGFDSGPAFSVGGALTFSGPGGSFVATIADGSTGSAFESPHTTDYDFQLLLTITGGTHRYAKVGGNLTLTYNTSANFVSPCPCPSDHGTLSGSVVLGAGSGT
ncbi:MAG TPA: hypothetical protein VE596_04695 [Gaiellaceae bacterium]|nr:hypothetical protein [Gaiellaceae bacterium]